MFKTWLTEKIGTRFPIVQGAMLWLSPAELAAAVSNAGGLGIITSASYPTPEAFRAEIRRMRDLTGGPFAVNISLLPSKRTIPTEEYILAATGEGVRIIETSGRSPEPYVNVLKASGALLMHKATRIRDLKTAERLGYDAVTIVGFEAGGHPGMDDVTSLVLIPRAVESIKLPVLAAGGFADGRGLVTALALGAQGIQMGTRFMLSREGPLHPDLKQFLLGKGENDTCLMLRSLKDAVRVIRTDFTQKVTEMEERGASFEEMYPLISGHRSRSAYEQGTADDSLLTCGETVGLIHEILPVREIIETTVREAEGIIGRLGQRQENLLRTR